MDKRRKTPLQKLTGNKDYKSRITGDFDYTQAMIEMLNKIEEKYRMTPAIIKSLINFVESNVSDGSDWLSRIDRIKELKSTITKERYIIWFGDEIGTKKWEEISNKKHESNTIEHYIKIHGVEKGTNIWNEINQKRAESGFRESYWIKKGFTQSEAADIVKMISKKGSLNGNKAQAKQREDDYADWAKKMPTTIHYWLERGYTEDEAHLKVSERQNTFSREKCIEKYGDDGIKKWEERQEKWQRSLHGNVNVQSGKASKESMIVFTPVITFLKNHQVEYLIGEDNNNEFIIKADGRRFLYDLTVPDLNLIFEYNGEAFHPNPKWLTENTTKWDQWKHPFSQKKAEDCHSFDCYKNNIARNNGFDVIEIWSSDDKMESSNKIIDIITQKLQLL